MQSILSCRCGPTVDRSRHQGPHGNKSRHVITYALLYAVAWLMSVGGGTTLNDQALSPRISFKAVSNNQTPVNAKACQRNHAHKRNYHHATCRPQNSTSLQNQPVVDSPSERNTGIVQAESQQGRYLASTNAIFQISCFQFFLATNISIISLLVDLVHKNANNTRKIRPQQHQMSI